MPYKQSVKLAVIVAIVAILAITISVAAESTGQKTMRLKRENDRGIESHYTRKRYTRPSEKRVDLRAPLHEHSEMETPAEKADRGDSMLEMLEKQGPVETVIPTPALSAPPPVASSPAGGAQPVLNLIGADSLACVTVNNLDETLAMTDSYLTGTIPMNVTMMAKMQIGMLLGNDTLAGLDTMGSFGFYLKHLPGEKDPLGVILLPVTDYSEFVASSRNISDPDGKGISTVTIGKVTGVTIRKATENYGMVILPVGGKVLPYAGSLIPDESIGAILDTEEMDRATNAPLWAYGNLDSASSIFGDKFLSRISQLQQQRMTAAAAAGQEQSPEDAEKQIAALQEATEQLKSVSATLTPTAESLKLEISFSAKAGTEIANALIADPDIKPGFNYAGYVSGPVVVAGLAKMNKPLMKKITELSLELFGSQFGRSASEYKQIAAAGIEVIGEEQAFYLDLSAQMPFIRTGKIVQTNDGQAMQEVFNKQVEITAEMAKNAPPSPFSGLLPQGQAVGDKFIVTWGVDAEMELSKLAELVAYPAPAAGGDIKIALDTIDNADSAGFVASLNLIRLLNAAKGFGPMIPVPQAKMAFDALANMNLTSTSCIAIAGRTNNGKANLQIALPKQHLQELFAAVTMIQQQMMMQMMQQMGNQPIPVTPRGVGVK